MLFAVFSAKALVYTVVVPEGTKACFIAGSMNGWTQEEMEQDADEPTLFTIDLPDATKADPYKYCSGPGWAYVEKNATGGEISDRTYPDDGIYVDYVETWAILWDPDAVEKEFTLNVTVPEGTLAVYVLGSFNNWNNSDFKRLQKVTETTYTLKVKAVADEINYKYSAGPNWDYVELNEDGTDLAKDRNLKEDASNDVVALWKDIFEPPAEFVLNVTVPEGTNACYVAGSMNGWSQQKMEKVTETTYTISFEAGELDNIEYKYCSGPGWDYVEVNEDGTDIGNRKLTLAGSPADDEVANWKAVYEPQYTLNVTVPAGTKACYVAGSMNGWSQQEMKKVTETTYTLSFAAGSMAEIEYKYCSGPGWDYVEVKEDGTDTANRKLAFADSPVNNEVAKWKAIYDPSGIVNVNVDNLTIIGEKAALKVNFSGSANVELYSVQGALINKTVAADSYNYTNLPAGVYILKINGKAYKALVK